MLIYIINTSFHMVTTTAIYDLSILPDLSRFPVGFAYCIYGCPLELLAMTTMWLPHAACVKQGKNLDWFPRMRAMSLAADDAESEQNELRNLQAQLAQTNELVETLSRQLNELKEQVSIHLWLIQVDEHIYAYTIVLVWRYR